MNQTKIMTSIESKKLNRKKFLLYSGSALFGLGLISNSTFKFFRSEITTKPSMKIVANPNAVKRKIRVTNNG